MMIIDSYFTLLIMFIQLIHADFNNFNAYNEQITSKLTSVHGLILYITLFCKSKENNMLIALNTMIYMQSYEFLEKPVPSTQIYCLM